MVGQQHFRTYEGEYHHEAVVDEPEFSQHSGNQEIHGAQAKDGQNVGAEYDKWIRRNGEYGWNAVQGEQNVGDFNNNQGQQKGRGRSNPHAFDKKPVAIQFCGNGNDLGNLLEDKGFLGPELMVTCLQHFVGGIKQKAPKNIYAVDSVNIFVEMV